MMYLVDENRNCPKTTKYFHFAHPWRLALPLKISVKMVMVIHTFLLVLYFAGSSPCSKNNVVSMIFHP
jgi:hypothetical protein